MDDWLSEIRPPAEDIPSVGALFRDSADRFGERICIRQKNPSSGEWVSHHWRDVQKMVEEVAASLLHDGVGKGDRVSILSNSRMEWEIADLAILTAGAVTVPIYQSNMSDEVLYILEHAGATVVFVEDGKQLSKLLQEMDKLPDLKRVIQFSGKVRSDDELVRSWQRYQEDGHEALDQDKQLVNKALAAVTPEDICTFVYTSGTTGRPKGAVLTHDTVLFEIDSLGQVLGVDPSDETLLFLPMAHILARIGYLGHLQLGYIISYAEGIPQLMTNMAEIEPTFVFSVPRIYEKFYTQITVRVRKGWLLMRQMFAFAMFIGSWVSRLKQQGKWAPWKYPHLALLQEMANMLVFNKLAKLFGGKLRFFISGGAPLSKEIAEFMHALGITVLEGWGLTETTAAATLNTEKDYKFGSVGKVLPGVEVKVAEDGELLIRGRNNLKEYHKRPEATAEALIDGWFHSGDIGEIDANGFVRITDRKKDLIVTAGGKNIAPQNIENLIKTAQFISQVVVHGDRKSYLVALLTLDEEEVRKYADEKDLEFETYAELTRHKRIRYKVDQEMAEKNKKLPSWETIKYWAVLEKDFEIGEELTPTLKVKRKYAYEKYKDIVEGLYK